MAIKYKLGRLPDKVDKRDYAPAKLATIPKLAAAAPKVVKLPAAVDLRNGFGPALNQGGLGSCTSCAGVGLYEYLDRKAFGRVEPRSRLFLYKNSRLLDGFRGDSGSYLRTTMKAMKLFGACPERYWPYTNIAGTYDLMPTAFQYAYGQNSQALTYFRLDPVGAQPATVLNNVKSYLTRGYPVMFGFLVYSSIWRAVQGNVPYPSRGEPCIGGHAVCCHPDTFILTRDGHKRISDIVIGTEVLTHEGRFKRVVDVSRRQVSEDICRIRTGLGSDLLVTKEHPLLSKHYSVQTKLTQTKRLGFLDKDMTWKQSIDLQKGDLFYLPICDEESVSSELLLEDDFFKLLGLYVGDGNINIRFSKNNNVKSARIRFTLGKDYPELIEEVKRLFRKYSSAKINVYEYAHYVILTCYDTALSKTILRLCGGAKHKYLSKEILFAPAKLQKEFIKGWYETDGCKTGNGFSIATAKENLMNDLTFILRRLRLLYTVAKIPKHVSVIRGQQVRGSGGFTIYVLAVDINTLEQKRTKHNSIYTDRFLVKKVYPKHLSVENYAGYVINLEIEQDNSYSANGLAAHNCAVGFNDAKQALLFRNSWGTGWGVNGYGWLPYSYISNRLASDFWTMTSAELLDSGQFS